VTLSRFCVVRVVLSVGRYRRTWFRVPAMSARSGRATVDARNIGMVDRVVGVVIGILVPTTLDGASYPLRNHAAASDELRRVTTGTNLR